MASFSKVPKERKSLRSRVSLFLQHLAKTTTKITTTTTTANITYFVKFIVTAQKDEWEDHYRLMEVSCFERLCFFGSSFMWYLLQVICYCTRILY